MPIDLQSLSKPDWHVSLDGETISANATTETIQELCQKLRELAQIADRGWVGARLASLFATYAELQSFSLRFNSEWQPSDEGGAYLSTTLSVEDVQLRDGGVSLAAPEDPDDPTTAEDGADDLEADDDNDEDSDSLAGLIDEDLCDEARSLAETLTAAAEDSDEDYSDFSITVNRDALGDLLNTTPISGLEAYRRLFAGTPHAHADE